MKTKPRDSHSAVPFCVEGGRHTGAQSSGSRVRMPYCRASARVGLIPAACPGGEARHLFVCSFWQSLAGGRCPPHAPKIFCMAGGRTGAQTSGFCVRMAFSQGFGKMQINSRRNAPGDSRTAVPFCVGCPLHTGARRKKIPYPVSFGIRYFEKGVNERGNQPCQPICASTNRHT